MTIDFKSLRLLPAILNALLKKGYTTPTPIQAKAIPHVMEGKDLLGIAQTGTGKTAAFSLPILNHLALNKIKVKPKNCRVLILTPTRELASQINDNIQTYGKEIGIRSTVIFGGVGKTPQINRMKQGVDILVATPGRLLDLMSEGYIKYEQLEVFVLDEADRMLDMGFLKDIKRVIAKLPKKKQTLLFSATMPDDIGKLATSLLKDPVRVEVTPESTTVEKIDQKLMLVARTDKPSLLLSILEGKEVSSVLVFSRTKHGADRIVKTLDRSGIASAAIHGNKSQGNREKALGNFRSGKTRVLVATDIAARGIDIPHVSHIINYNMPEDPESYVHRIGRTARAGREGVAISFCDETEMKLLKSVEKMIRMKIPVDDSHPFKKLTMRDPEPETPKGAKKSFGKGKGRNSKRPSRNSSKRTGAPKPKAKKKVHRKS